MTGQFNRRSFIQLALWSAAGALAANKGALAMNHDHHAFLADNPTFIDQPLIFFTDAQRALVTRIADLIIPRTDTPGAVDAGAPAFIELMAHHYLRPDEQKRFVGALDQMIGDSFLELDEAAQIKTLEAMESDAAATSSWYAIGQFINADFDGDAPFICQIKDLTLCGTFLSEVGANEILRHNGMPGYFEGETQKEPDQPSWATSLHGPV